MEVRAQSNTVGRLWFFWWGDAREYPGGLLRFDPAFAMFVFTNLLPDKYKLELYYGDKLYMTTKVKVKKNQSAYKNLKLSKDQKPKK